MKKSVFTGLFIFLICGLILSACFSPWKGGDEQVIVMIILLFTIKTVLEQALPPEQAAEPQPPLLS